MSDANVPSQTSNQPRLRCLLSMSATLAGFITFASVAFREHNQGYAAFASFWVVLALAALLSALRSISRGEYGSATAWEVCALPLVAIVTVLSYGLTITQDTVGLLSLPATPAYWFPFFFFAGSMIFILACIRSTRRSLGS